MEALRKIFEALEKPGALPQRLQESELQEGLQQLEAILGSAVGVESRDLEKWSKQQLNFVLTALDAVLSAFSNSVADGGEKEVVEQIFGLTVQFCLHGLENIVSKLGTGSASNSDEEMQQKLLLLLEMATLEGKATQHTSLFLVSFSDGALSVPDFDFSTKLEGEGQSYHVTRWAAKDAENSSFREADTAENILALLSSEQFLVQNLSGSGLEAHVDVLLKPGGSMVVAAQHYAVVQAKCIPRLLFVCKVVLMACRKGESEEDDKQLQGWVSLVSSILTFLGEISRAEGRYQCAEEFVEEIVDLASAISVFSHIAIDSCSSEPGYVLDSNLGCLVPTLIDDFLQLAVTLLPDANLFLNLRTYLTASMLYMLPAGKWRQDVHLPYLQISLACTPNAIIRLLGLFHEVQSHSYEPSQGISVHHDIGARLARIGCPPGSLKQPLVRPLRSKQFNFNDVRDRDEHMQTVFASDGLWLDHLVAAIALLHALGLKEGSAVEAASSIHSEEESAVGSVDSVAAVSEDDALFGDLFSESGRHSVHSEGIAQPCSSAKKLDGLYNTPLQATYQLLTFLKDSVLCADWHRPTFEIASKNLSKELLDVFLQVHFSQSNLAERHLSVYESVDLVVDSDLQSQLRKVSYDLIEALVSRKVLSETLETHLANQILSEGDFASGLNTEILVLLARLLINRYPARISNTEDDPLVFMLWKNFVDSTVHRAKSKLVDIGMQKALAILPSLFHMEVLFMAFHSVSPSGRESLLQTLLSALKALKGYEKLPGNGAALAVWSLLVSRLVLAVRYIVLHFNTFPKWMLLDLRNTLRPQSSESDRNILVDDMPTSSWAATVARSISHVQSADERFLVEVCSDQLFDISEFCFAGFLKSEEVSILQRLHGLGDVLDDFLEAWRDKTVKSVEELLVERYMFLLSWSVLHSDTFATEQDALWDVKLSSSNSFGAEFVFGLGRNLLGSRLPTDSWDVNRWTTFMISNFSRIEEELSHGGASLMSWQFLRLGASLSLLLSLLQAGLWNFSKNQRTVDEGKDGNEEAQDGDLLVLLEQCVVLLLKDTAMTDLLKSLSSLLTFYIDALRQTVVHVLQENSSRGALSSTALLLRGVSSGKKQQHLLESAGINIGTVQTLLRWGPFGTWKSDTIALLLGPFYDNCFRDLNNIFLPALLHGFPSSSHSGSAAVVSSMLSIEGILETLEGILNLKGLEEGILRDKLDKNVFEDIVGSVMTMSLDSTFENIRSKCIPVLDSLIPLKEEQAKYCDMFLLRHVEELLKTFSGREEVDEMVQEVVIAQAVDAVSAMRKDVTRSQAIKFYYFSDQEDDRSCSSEKQERWRFANVRPLVGTGSLSPYIDALIGCPNEVVNQKILQLLVEFLSGESSTQLEFKRGLQKKFLSMDMNALAVWLELRLLGGNNAASNISELAVATSLAVRETASNIIEILVTPSNDMQDQALRSHLVTAMLVNLERVFVNYEVGPAKDYFGLLVQLAVGEVLIKQVLSCLGGLIEKLTTDGNHLERLKSILAYLNSIFLACGAQKVLTQSAFNNGRVSSAGSGFRCSISSGSKPKSAVVKKSSEQLLLPGMDPSAPSADSDAISVDEDEDDATSDGELASLDREDEDDGNNSERVLASKVCTFASSGSNFMMQHWYFCYTCDLTVAKGCCSICARVCHRGHKIVYSRLSRFFCDCGGGGLRGTSCLCLKPRKYVALTNAVPTTSSDENSQPFTGHMPAQSDSDTDAEESEHLDCEGPFNISLSDREERGVLAFLTDLNIEGQVLTTCERLLSQLNVGQNVTSRKDEEIVLGGDKLLNLKNDLLQLKRAYKSGSLDMKIKAEYPNARDLKSHLVSGTIVKSLLTISSRGRLAAGEGDKVTIFDVGQLIGQPTATTITMDKTIVKPLSKNAVRFELVQLAFNTVNESYLAVAGYEDCQVFTVNTRGEVTDRLAVELALLDAHICGVAWVPGSQVQLMVVTNRFLKIYDLSQDKISPTHYFTVLEDSIADACLVSKGQGQLVALVLSQQGVLYSQRVSAGGNFGARILTENIQLPDSYKPGRGISLSFSASYKLLLMSCSDGLTVMGRLNGDLTKFVEVSNVLEAEQDGKTRPSGLHHWKEVFEGSGLFISLSTQKSNSAVAVQIGAVEMQAQQLRISGNASSLRVDGVAAYRPMTKDRNSVFVLHDDGSLQVFSYIPSDTEAAHVLSNEDNQKQSSTFETEQVKKLGAALLGSRTHSGTAPVFPLDFFEKTNCITADIKLGGEVLRNSDSESVKQSLAAEDGFLESPSANGFKILIYNTHTDIVMVGCRVQVGYTAASHIPTELRLFQRTIRLEEGVRSWYDLPFTNSEALLADEEFTLTVGPTFNGSSLPRLDTLEVYGRSKDDFGWKEKLDAVLDLESQGQGASGSVTGSSVRGAKHKLLQSASVLEQVYSDSFHLLHNYYMAYRSQIPLELEEVKLEPCRIKCLPVLESVFECDRQPLLQSAARHVLCALYPLKEAYYQAKDSMRLSGVARSCPTLVSRISNGGFASSLVIQEFSAQMHAVCKIALHRQSNLASFLDRNGTSIIDGLVKVLWEILTWEQLDAQTINNLVIPMVDLIYGYAECLALHTGGGVLSRTSVSPAVTLLRKLLFSPDEAVRTSCSLAISSTLLQVPLPKQTMLAMDDIAENSRATSIPSDSGSGSGGAGGQVMLDEDANTASVQYCCDGCSTVPILRQRWHCNICPDFDLCEACYEVMDADQLPPPHNRDHPMSAVPVEMDLVGGENSEMQFSSIDELSDESLLQIATELSLQASGSPVNFNSAMDANENVLPHVPEGSKGVAISASRSAVNGLLLQGLVEEIQGWMRSSTGAQALPVMQLFYRLASAASGPLSESSSSYGVLDLEQLVKFMLRETDLNVPLVVTTRSNFGEVMILTLMFFTLVLRNWHQPGSEQQSRSAVVASDSAQNSHQSSSVIASNGLDGLSADGGTQLDRACAALRYQALINYLLNIVQQLTSIFKSSSRNSESTPTSSTGTGCGSLLNVRREFASGSYSPFFSDSYAKAHRGDLFGDFHRLMLESVFRLTYSLIRPEKSEKGNEKEQIFYKASAISDLKLDGWQEALCNFINNPHTTFIRKYARRLLLHLCGSKGHYYNVRDAWQLNREVKRLRKLAQKSGGFQVPVSYERSVKLVKCLTVIAEAAAARPRNWQKYCSKHIDDLQFLLTGMFSFGEESVIQALKLLMLVFYSGKDIGSASKLPVLPEVHEGGSATNSTRPGVQSGDVKKKGRSGTDDGSSYSGDKSYMDMEQAVDQLAADDGKILQKFIDCFLLEWNSSSVRSEAKSVLHGAWNHGKRNFRMLMLKSLMQRIAVLPSYGQNIVEYTDLLTWLLGKGGHDVPPNSPELAVVQGCLNEDAVTGIFGALCAQNELLANHPNSRIYTTLASLVEFDGYYLESEPCLACSCPELPYTRMKLDNLKSETKFTDNRILVKCLGSHTIQSVTMNVHDARRSKSVKVLNLYYNNRAVADLSELKNNRSLWKRARSCHLSFNQTELKVEFPIPITACNFMIELDSFYENLQASSLESLQCPRCSRYVTDKHGICSNCHENAYQCRQCRNINYENLDSFLCNECGYSKYGRFEFNFMAKPSFTFDSMENDDDMKKGLAAIETESENAHRKYQQLLGFKKPLLKLVSSIGETEVDSQQKDSVQQMIVSLPGSSSFKINRKIVILGVLYGEKCKSSFDSVSKSVQTLQGLRRVLMAYLERKRSAGEAQSAQSVSPRPTNRCFGCANTFVAHCLEWLQVLAKHPRCRKQLVTAGILRELFENNIHQGPKAARIQARTVLCTFTEGDATAVSELNNLIRQKTMYCLDHHRSMDVAACVRDELQLLSETCSLTDEFWEDRLRVVFQLLFRSIQVGARHPVIAEQIILPCLRIVSQACTPPKSETGNVEVTASASPLRSEFLQRVDRQESADVPQRPEARLPASDIAKSPQETEEDLSSNMHKIQSVLNEKEGQQEARAQDSKIGNLIEWKNGSTYLDFVKRQYMVSQLTRPAAPKVKIDSRHGDQLALKYLLKWKQRAYKGSVTDELSAFEESSWVHELVLSACSQAIRLEMCALIEVLCAQSPVRRAKFLNLLMTLLPSTRAAGESAAEYFDLLFKMVEPEDSRLFLTVRGFLQTACSLITEEVRRIDAQEWSVHTDISQGYILHKLIELLSKFLRVPNIRTRFMKEDLLSQILQALLALRGLIVQKTKLTGDCGRLLRDLLDGLLQESYENKRHFVRACISGLQSHCWEKKDRTSLFILEQLCDIICPTKPEQAYMMVLNKVHSQEEFIRGSMTKNPYSSLEIGPLMRDVKNKICHQLELIGLIEDDYGMELLVAGNIISLDLSVAQVSEQVWKKAHLQASVSVVGSSILTASSGPPSVKDCPPMSITYRLQGLDGEATEPMIKELEEDREESQDPEVEFAIAGVMRECGGLEIILNMVQKLSKLEMKAAQEELALVLKLLMFCCKIRANRQALLQLGALGVLLEAARRAFSSDAAEPAEGLLLIVESLVSEANESDLGVSDSFSTSSRGGGNGSGEQAASAVLMFLEKLSHPTAVNKSNKQQRNNDTVARILPYLTYGEEAAMEVLVGHFLPYLEDWVSFDKLVKQHHENPKDDVIANQAAQQQLALDNFVRVTEAIKLNSNGERLKNLIMKKKITTGAILYLKSAFPGFNKGVEFRSTPEWAQGLEMPSVPIILSMLRGLSRGHKATQQSLDKEGILPLLHALEGVSGDNEIGARAENLMDTLADKESNGEGFLLNKVLTLRHATRDEMHRRALQRREELLSGLGMRREVRSDGVERIVVSKPHIEGLEEVEEEEAGLACMVCREGYKLRPTDMLGAYCYSKRTNLALGLSSHVRAEWVYTTVSHFNVIHFQCHQEAKRADASLKNPKKEWEGATLRNSETLCNNLFPLRGPAVPLAQYARCVDQYWDNLNSLGRADGSRLRLLIHDIVMMLARFSTGKTGSSFSIDSKGGGRESNSRLLPFMVQMARHLLDQGGASQRRGQAKGLVTYLSPSPAPEAPELGFKPSTPPSSQRAGTIDESVQFMMVQSLLLQSVQDWKLHRRTILQRAVLHAYVEYKNGRSLLPTLSLPSPLPSRNTFDFGSNLKSPDSKHSEEARDDIRVNLISGEQLFTIVQPMLVYVGLVDQMQHFLKGGIVKARDVAERDDRKSSISEIKDEGSVHLGIEQWETSLKDRLRDVGALLGFAKDMLEWLEEMQGTQDIQEALDVMGALGDALTGSQKTCEDFVRDAIASSQFR